MAHFLTDPAIYAHQLLKKAGCSLSQDQLLEVYAAMFGYGSLGEMDEDAEDIEYTLGKAGTYVALDIHSAAERMRSLCDEHVPDEQLVPFMALLKNEWVTRHADRRPLLSCALPTESHTEGIRRRRNHRPGCAHAFPLSQNSCRLDRI